MADNNGKIVVFSLTVEQLQLIINALGSSSPGIDKEDAQFKLYHDLILRLNSMIRNE